jgi:hypothetical protein
MLASSSTTDDIATTDRCPNANNAIPLTNPRPAAYLSPIRMAVRISQSDSGEHVLVGLAAHDFAAIRRGGGECV